MCNKTKCKIKKYFRRCCLQCFSSKKTLAEDKEVCLKINCKQTVKLKIGSIKFKNYRKQLVVPFQICADFECNVKKVKSSDRGDKVGKSDNTSYTEDHIS